jgi:hypothetical protein
MAAEVDLVRGWAGGMQLEPIVIGNPDINTHVGRQDITADAGGARHRARGAHSWSWDRNRTESKIEQLTRVVLGLVR